MSVNEQKKEGVTKIEDLPSSNENIKLDIKETSHNSGGSINMNDIFKEVYSIGKAGNLTLPSKDIPMNPSTVTMDEKGFTDYIPKHNNYIETMYEPMEDIKESQRKKQNNRDSLEALYEEFQSPILMAILFFVFCMPFVNDFLYKHIKMIFKSDGNLNMYGYIVKSILFTSSFYGINRIIEYISD